MKRREFLALSSAAGLSTLLGCAKASTLTVSASSCAHTSKNFQNGYLSFAEPMQQLAGLDPDLILNFGDWSSATDVNDPQQMTQAGIDRVQAQIEPYKDRMLCLAGNHDGAPPNMAWYLAAIEGTNQPAIGMWDSHYTVAGNLCFIMMSDRNDLPWPWGRLKSPQLGGHPSGTWTTRQLAWLQSVLKFCTITQLVPIVCSHSTPRDTTIATSAGSNSQRWHGNSGISEGRGACPWSIYDPDTGTADDGTFLPQQLCTAAGVPLWLGGHTHCGLHETDNTGRSRFEIVGGVTYWKCGHLTYHFGGNAQTSSALLTFTHGSAEVVCDMFVHRHPTRPVGVAMDWRRVVTLPHAFRHF